MRIGLWNKNDTEFAEWQELCKKSKELITIFSFFFLFKIIKNLSSEFNLNFKPISI